MSVTHYSTDTHPLAADFKRSFLEEEVTGSVSELNHVVWSCLESMPASALPAL